MQFSRLLFAGVCLSGVAPLAAAQTAGAAGANAFNPAMSLVLNGSYGVLGEDPASYALPGFALGEEAGPGARGFSLGESELTLQANIDTWFFGSMTAALANEDGETVVELEESYFQTLALPAGFTLKGGRFFSRIGYLNEQHAHADDFVDRPLVYRALFGGHQYGDDGVQLRWLAPVDVFLEFGAETFRGEDFPAGGSVHQGTGTWTAFAHLGDDLGTDYSYRVGLSYLSAQARGRETGELPDVFDGESKTVAADFVLKWAPGGNPKNTNFKLQGEWMRRDEQGLFNGADYDGKQDGWYLQGVWQFAPQWRGGLRYDALASDNTGAALAGSAVDSGGHDPRRVGALLEFDHSDFSRLRLQYNRDESQAVVDDQIFVNYVYSLGAHAAHAF